MSTQLDNVPDPEPESQREINATLIRRLPDFHGDARLYRLSVPVPIGYEHPHRARRVSEYVIVSAVVAIDYGPETYIFGASADGEVVDWGEMPGSFRGALDHDAAIRGAGWTLS